MKFELKDNHSYSSRFIYELVDTIKTNKGTQLLGKAIGYIDSNDLVGNNQSMIVIDVSDVQYI